MGKVNDRKETEKKIKLLNFFFLYKNQLAISKKQIYALKALEILRKIITVTFVIKTTQFEKSGLGNFIPAGNLKI